MLIRKATKKDITQILDLQIKLMKYHKKYCGYDIELFRQKKNRIAIQRKFLEKRIRARNGRIFVAENGKGKIVGYVNVNGRVLRPPIYVHEKEAYIDGIVLIVDTEIKVLEQSS